VHIFVLFLAVVFTVSILRLLEVTLLHLREIKPLILALQILLVIADSLSVTSIELLI